MVAAHGSIDSQHHPQGGGPCRGAAHSTTAGHTEGSRGRRRGGGTAYRYVEGCGLHRYPGHMSRVQVAWCQERKSWTFILDSKVVGFEGSVSKVEIDW